MNIRVGWIVGVVSMALFSTAVVATEIPFVLDRGFVYPDAFDGGRLGTGVGFVFQNPARIVSRERSTARGAVVGSSSPDFFGYTQLSLAGIVSEGDVALGGGVVSFSADDISEAVINLDGRPEATGVTFSDSLTRYVGAMGYRFWEDLLVGVRGSYFQRTLGDNSVSFYGVDIGVYYHPNESVGVGFYTRNLFKTPYQWKNSREPEKLPAQIVLEADYRFSDFYSRISTDMEWYRAVLQYQMHPYFGVHGDVVLDDDFSVNRYGIGTQLAIGRVMVSYWYFLLETVGADEARHELGVGYAF